MQKLVFSRYSGKLGTATRHQGPKTGTVWSVRENPSKSPKRPALPGAVNREGAVSRHRPFVLLLFHTPPGALIRGFFQPCLCGAEFGFLGLGAGRFPTLGRNPAHRPSQPRETRCFSEGKNGCCAPEGFSGSSRRLGLAHGGQQEDSVWTAAGCEKAAAGSCWAAALGFMIAFAGNFQFLPHPPARTGTWPAGSPPTP